MDWLHFWQDTESDVPDEASRGGVDGVFRDWQPAPLQIYAKISMAFPEH